LPFASECPLDSFAFESSSSFLLIMGNQQSGASNAQQPGGPGAEGPRGAGSSSASASQVNYTSTQANGTGTMTQARKGPGIPVILNIYEPSKPQTSMPGFGIYHTGIEISGVEYSYAGGPDAGSGTGVMTQQPRATPAGGEWKFKEAKEIGVVNFSSSEFSSMLNELKDAFRANQYHIVHQNCNHFTAMAAKRLGVDKNYPSWVNRAASWGKMFVDAPKGHQAAELAKPKESVFKTTTGYSLQGGGAAKTTNTKALSASSSSSGSSGGSSIGSKPEEKKKDEKKSSKDAKPRKNPWADPSFVPPQMRSDPVVATGKVDI
jgi:hypothetical protein